MRTHSQNHAHASFNIDLKLHFIASTKHKTKKTQEKP